MTSRPVPLGDVIRNSMIVALRNGYTVSELRDSLRAAEDQVREEQRVNEEALRHSREAL